MTTNPNNKMKTKEQILKDSNPTSNHRYYWPMEAGIAMEVYTKQQMASPSFTPYR